MAALQISGLFDLLPRELREQIWATALQNDVSMAQKTAHGHQLALLRTNSAIYGEAHELLYADRTISIAFSHASDERILGQPMCPSISLTRRGRPTFTLFKACKSAHECPRLNTPRTLEKALLAKATCFCRYNGQLYIKPFSKIEIVVPRVESLEDVAAIDAHAHALSTSRVLSRRHCSVDDLARMSVRFTGRESHRWFAPPDMMVQPASLGMWDELDLDMEEMDGALAAVARFCGPLVCDVPGPGTIEFEVPDYWAARMKDLPVGTRWMGPEQLGKRVLRIGKNLDWWRTFEAHPVHQALHNRRRVCIGEAGGRAAPGDV